MSLGRGRGPRGDDEWCLINPFVLGARADVIFHHDLSCTVLGWLVFQGGVFRWNGGGGVVVVGH